MSMWLPFWWLWLVRGIRLCRSLWEGCLLPSTSYSHDCERLWGLKKKCIVFVISICCLFEITFFNSEVKFEYLCYLKRSSPTQTSWRTPHCSQGCWGQDTMTFQLNSLSIIMKNKLFLLWTSLIILTTQNKCKQNTPKVKKLTSWRCRGMRWYLQRGRTVRHFPSLPAT